MPIGTYVFLVNRHDFRNGQPDLSEALGKVCETQEDCGQKLISVVFDGLGVMTPCVPVELFEPVTIH